MGRRIVTSDQRPGPMPTIQSVEDSITFVMSLDEVQPGARLRLRCDAKGNVWVSTTPAVTLDR